MTLLRKPDTTTDYSFRNRVQLVYGGRDYFELLYQLIREATASIDLQFYIFENDLTGREVANELMAAARRGVPVRLQVDAYASPHMAGRWARELQTAGVEIRWFEPMFRSRHFYFGRRLHHKVVVADGRFALVGGINVSDRYNDLPGSSAWFDTALWMEGEAAALLQQIVREMWGVKTEPGELLAAMTRAAAGIPEEEQITLRIRRNDWVKRKMQVWKTYLDLFSKARHSITLLSSYFLPGRLFRKKISQAVKRGVRIRVILAGRSDIAMAKHAERFLYDWLLRNKVEIYEYQPSVLHAKLGVCDGHLVTIGSYNVNNISAYASLELNVNVYNQSFAGYVEREMDRIIAAHCKPITYENFTRTENIFRIGWQRFCYSFINNVLNLFTFYFRQEE